MNQTIIFNAKNFINYGFDFFVVVYARV